MSAADTDARVPDRDSRSTKDIERDLAHTREEFGETLEALSAKMDVKTRAKHWSRETAATTQRRVKVLIDQRGRELAIAGGAVAAVVLALMLKRARKR